MQQSRTQQSPLCLLDLPDELLLFVFEGLEPGDFFAISLVCQRLRLLGSDRAVSPTANWKRIVGRHKIRGLRLDSPDGFKRAWYRWNPCHVWTDDKYRLVHLSNPRKPFVFVSPPVVIVNRIVRGSNALVYTLEPTKHDKEEFLDWMYWLHEMARAYYENMWNRRMNVPQTEDIKGDWRHMELPFRSDRNFVSAQHRLFVRRGSGLNRSAAPSHALPHWLHLLWDRRHNDLRPVPYFSAEGKRVPVSERYMQALYRKPLRFTMAMYFYRRGFGLRIHQMMRVEPPCQ